MLLKQIASENIKQTLIFLRRVKLNKEAPHGQSCACSNKNSLRIFDTDLENMLQNVWRHRKELQKTNKTTEDCRRPIPDKPVPTPIQRVSELMRSEGFSPTKQPRVQQTVTLAEVYLSEARQNPNTMNGQRLAALHLTCFASKRAGVYRGMFAKESRTSNRSLMESRWKYLAWAG